MERHSKVSMLATIKHYLFSWTKNKNKRNAALLSMAVLVGGFVIIFFMLLTAPIQSEQKIVENIFSIDSVTVDVIDDSPMVPLFGRVESLKEAKLTSSLAADVKSVLVQEGEYVKAGQRLFLMNDAEWKLRVSLSQAEVDEAKAELASIQLRTGSNRRLLEHEQAIWSLAKATLAKQQTLLTKQAISQAVVDKTTLELKQQAIKLENQRFNVEDSVNREALASANLNKAETELAKAELALSYTTITAPFDGVISKVLISEGDRLQIASPTIHLFDQSTLRVRATIPSDHVSDLKKATAEGESIAAKVVSHGNTIPLELIRLTSSVSGSGTSVDGLFQVKGFSESLVLGQMLSIDLSLPTMNNVVSIPPQALYEGDRVYAINNEQLTAVDVEFVGEQNKASQYALLVRSDQLQTGMKVLSSYLPNAQEGLKVKLNDISKPIVINDQYKTAGEKNDS